MWQKKQKVWKFKERPMMNYLHRDRGANFTMIGCISTKKGERPYVEIAKKTNKFECLRFFRNYLPHHQGAVLILDNHKAHKGKELKNICADNNVELLFLPPISSTLNPVERLWSWVKFKFSEHLIDHPAMTPDQGPDVAMRIINSIE